METSHSGPGGPGSRRAGSPDLVLFLAALLPATLSLFLPGETWFQTRALGQLLACGLLAVLLFLRRPAGEGRDAGRPAVTRLAAAVALFLVLVAPSLLASRCPGRSLETAFLLLAYLALFLLLWGLRLEDCWVRGFLRFFSLAVVLLLLYGLYQRLAGLDRLAAEIAADPGLAVGRKSAMLRRVASGRVFSAFPLPTTFAVLIVISFPLLLHQFQDAWRRGARPAAVGWAAALFLAAAVLVLTGSYGALPVLAVTFFAALLLHSGRRARRRSWTLLAVLLLAVLAFFLVLRVRGATPWDTRDPHSPVTQRLLNWRTAHAMWRDHPLAGIGLGNFAVAYAPRRLRGANETRVAHNSYLHLAAEGGSLPAAALLLLVLLFLHRGLALRRRPGEEGAPDWGPPLFLSSLALILYALIEITIEFPGLGFIGTTLVALSSRTLFPPAGQRNGQVATAGRALAAGAPAAFVGTDGVEDSAAGETQAGVERTGACVPPGRRPPAPPGSERGSSRAESRAGEGRWRLPAAVFLVLVLGTVMAWTLLWHGAEADLQRARDLAAGGAEERAEALALAARAARRNPLDPEPHLLRGEILLGTVAGPGRRDALGEALAAYSRAAELDPDRAFVHHRLSVIEAELGRPLACYLESDRARRLYPRLESYRQLRERALEALGQPPCP